MKNPLTYNINSIIVHPSFFPLFVLSLYLISFLNFFRIGLDISDLLSLITGASLLFTLIYPFFALLMAFAVRKAYINIYQTSVPKVFANKVVLYSRLLIAVMFIIFLIPVFRVISEESNGYSYAMEQVFFFLLWGIPGLLFLFHLFILPIFIRLILLKSK